MLRDHVARGERLHQRVERGILQEVLERDHHGARRVLADDIGEPAVHQHDLGVGGDLARRPVQDLHPGVELGGVRDVAEHPTLGTLAAVTYDEGTKDPGPAIAVRGKDRTWSPVALVDEEVESLAVLPDGSILAGTWQGALRLSDCAWH